MKRPTHGLVIGKFLPPHLGHKYLIDFAAGYADTVTVLVCTLSKQPIPGRLRFEWMRRSFGSVQVLHHTAELPEEPEDASSPGAFWTAWRDSILSLVSTPIDYVFASEPYGVTLAEVLGARFVPCDPNRELVPVSGTAIRADFAPEWEYILPAARPYFVRRIAILGPESSGKSVLAQKLALRYGTRCAAEYARTYLDAIPSEITPDVMAAIVRGHRASEDALAEQCSGGLLFCDTDAVTTKLWSRFFLGTVPPEVEQQVSEARYALSLVTRPTRAWVEDPQRFQPSYADREKFSNDCLAELTRLQRPFVVLGGTWEERTEQATAAVNAFLQRR